MADKKISRFSNRSLNDLKSANALLLAAVIDKANYTLDVNEIAHQAELDTLQHDMTDIHDKLGNKADWSYIYEMESDVYTKLDAKAEQSDLDVLSYRIDNIPTDITAIIPSITKLEETKADKAELYSVSALAESKASQYDVNELYSIKANTSDLDTLAEEVGKKADWSALKPVTVYTGEPAQITNDTVISFGDKELSSFNKLTTYYSYITDNTPVVNFITYHTCINSIIDKQIMSYSEIDSKNNAIITNEIIVSYNNSGMTFNTNDASGAKLIAVIAD